MTYLHCNFTKKKILLQDALLAADATNGEWFVCCQTEADKKQENGFYVLKFSLLIKTPEEFIDSMALLNRKPWFDPQKFFNFFSKVRALIT